MHYLTIKTELSFDTATDVLVNLLTLDYNIVLKQHPSNFDEGRHESLLTAMRIVLEYYGGEQALQRIEPQQQEMEL